MAEKKFKQVCTCENCGNEAEMVVTCEWIEVEEEKEAKTPEKKGHKVKGTGTCTNCGTEADIWVDM
ncbi:hypothetical protein [Desulfospira joergensenii]|uniref:hypothetical protein n=1 Tax=Desulfospira joergensenii TaxID=53329 RepID=UPI0003B2F6E8|nr:hypothetical protein [Desulfospira joergensenii]